eukprot:CCRYP_020359-RA/>CCRYP_020359-RA protein AED:0.10 eAED:0.10 QI:236/1/1/1/0.85/0.75/8/252/634
MNAAKPQKQFIAVRVGYAACPSCIHSASAASGESLTGGDCSRDRVTAVRNAIFLSWDDARHFVDYARQDAERAGGAATAAVAVEEGVAGSAVEASGRSVVEVPYYSNVEWRAFDTFSAAEAYLRRVMEPSSTSAPLRKTKKKKLNRKKIYSKHAIPSTYLTTAARPRNRGPPTKKWLQMYQLATEYKSTHNALVVSPTDVDNAPLYRWIKYQRDSYKLYLEDALGGSHSMTNEKVKMLSDLGFSWIAGDKKRMLEAGMSVRTGKRGRPRKVNPVGENDDAQTISGIHQKWMGMYEKLKAYAQQHGTTHIPKDTTDEELIQLRLWCSTQKSRYAMLQKGTTSKGMSQEKIDLLQSIGFSFPPNWNEMYAKLVAFKKEHGHLRVTPAEDAALAQWLVRQNEVLGRHLQGKSTRLSDEQVMKFLSLGVVGGRNVVAAQEVDVERDEKWNEMLLKLRAYKAEHGHCNVPTSLCTELSNWVASQRRMYNKLISGKPGKRAVLDAIKMQRLTELGFQFRPRGSYESWDDQIEKLRRFKEEHGHCRVPVSHPILGNFVKLARREYKLKQQGNKSSMTADRERDLREIGFVFEGGKTPQRREAMNKSWEERFQELLRFKEENGHTVVPRTQAGSASGCTLNV